ncbi:hypothetical protein SAY86_005573 [Trapa natans]|uniref:Uncharacterized protein n=1 Tax=Trapa natans TaxID=22666 RepID=A0AAN7QUX6_TRANT|nr:hypothetical protein SAY86_005573 [Trapa natans]
MSCCPNSFFSAIIGVVVMSSSESHAVCQNEKLAKPLMKHHNSQKLRVVRRRELTVSNTLTKRLVHWTRVFTFPFGEWFPLSASRLINFPSGLQMVDNSSDHERKG